MNKPWERKPNKDPDFTEYRVEDLFQCHNCKKYYHWVNFCKGKVLALGGNADNTYDFMDDNEDRGGRIWACDDCIDKILYNNNIITIRDYDGKIINMKKE